MNKNLSSRIYIRRDVKLFITCKVKIQIVNKTLVYFQSHF